MEHADTDVASAFGSSTPRKVHGIDYAACFKIINQFMSRHHWRQFSSLSGVDAPRGIEITFSTPGSFMRREIHNVTRRLCRFLRLSACRCCLQARLWQKFIIRTFSFIIASAGFTQSYFLCQGSAGPVEGDVIADFVDLFRPSGGAQTSLINPMPNPPTGMGRIRKPPYQAFLRCFRPALLIAPSPITPQVLPF